MFYITILFYITRSYITTLSDKFVFCYEKMYYVIFKLLLLLFIKCQTQQRSIITRKTKTHKQIYQAQHKT